MLIPILIFLLVSVVTSLVLGVIASMDELTDPANDHRHEIEDHDVIGSTIIQCQ
jgi:hypothetical protein